MSKFYQKCDSHLTHDYKNDKKVHLKKIVITKTSTMQLYNLFKYINILENRIILS